MISTFLYQHVFQASTARTSVKVIHSIVFASDNAERAVGREWRGVLRSDARERKVEEVDPFEYKAGGGVDEAAGRRIHTRWFLAPSRRLREEKREEKSEGERKEENNMMFFFLLLAARRRNRNIFCLASKRKRKRYASFARRRATRAKWSVTVENDVFSFCSGCARGSLFRFSNLEIVLSGFGFIYPCLLPVSAYSKSSDAEDKKTKPRVLKWQEFKLKLYSLAYCVFNLDIPRRWVEKCYEKLIAANESVPDAVVRKYRRFTTRILPEFDCEKFFREYVKRPHPVVLKGFAKDTKAAEWTLIRSLKSSARTR